MSHTTCSPLWPFALTLGGLLLALGGCNIDYKVVEAEESAGSGSSPGGAGNGAEGAAGSDADTGHPSSGGAGSSSLGGWGGSTGVGGATGAGVCRHGGECLEIAVTNIDKIDLLLMVDNSGSMSEEQEALRVQFPRLITVLATGDRDGDGNNDFPPAKNLHLGVVSSDLGLVGIRGIDKCDGLGNDGILNNVASPLIAGCSATGYPRFLTYTAGTNAPEQTATDLACIATLGTDGCGFEQQLETTLKALWPSDDPRVTFLPDPQGFGANGQGDAVMGGAPGRNAGFLRNDPVEGLSLISIVVVTDEEDCSSKDTSHFRPPAYLDPNDMADAQLLMQGLNTRCNFNPQNLYSKERYINGFKALRPGNEELVLFSAIVGVPPETVATVPDDYGTSEDARAQFYAGIRDHALMQPMVDSLGTPSPDDDTMRPSCDTATGKAYPPNRIVDVAEGFGENGMVQSICQDDFGPAVDAIVDRVGERMGARCLPREVERNDDGRVSCDVIWQLPLPNRAPVGTPVSCSQAPFLLDLDGGATDEMGRALCRVAQLSVRPANVEGMAPVPTETDGVTFSDGWYYDDFSDDVVKECGTLPKARIAFTPGAMPPTGVNVFLDCEP